MISYELFEKSIHAISTQINSNKNFSKFLEKNICENSFCYVTCGEGLINILIDILCHEFNLETDNEFFDNTISWWLFENVDKIIYYEDGTKRDISNLRDFYDYLVEVAHSSCHSSSDGEVQNG